MAAELKVTRKFDTTTFRHYTNDWNAVLHCHHYAALYSQLADDAGDLFDGPKILTDSAVEAFFPVLQNYFQTNQVNDLADRAKIVEDFYAFTGMGKLVVKDSSEQKGQVEMPFSHIDSGWIKKWGNRQKSVNFITSGYIKAAFAAMHNQAPENYEVTETASIVAGADKSQFSVTKK
ncbi:hypothetical protein JW964_04715 [candidate division KSB1 bacterium]|nr:hypothetical protein [candidate division KSB1 bacterium]